MQVNWVNHALNEELKSGAQRCGAEDSCQAKQEKFMLHPPPQPHSNFTCATGSLKLHNSNFTAYMLSSYNNRKRSTKLTAGFISPLFVCFCFGGICFIFVFK